MRFLNRHTQRVGLVVHAKALAVNDAASTQRQQSFSRCERRLNEDFGQVTRLVLLLVGDE